MKLADFNICILLKYREDEKVIKPMLRTLVGLRDGDDDELSDKSAHLLRDLNPKMLESVGHGLDVKNTIKDFLQNRNVMTIGM